MTKFLIVSGICWTALAITFLILMNQKDSRLKSNLLEICAWFGLGGSAAAIVSPVDLIPDFILGAGQADDLVMLVIAVRMVFTIIKQNFIRRRLG